MRRLLYIIGMLIITLSCERRELTYNYDATAEVIISADWSKMSEKPTGMSVYCYPVSGDKPIVKQTNNINYASLNLPAGIYNILVFNQIPSDYGTINFSGLESFNTAEINSVATKSNWVKSVAEKNLIRDPEEVAAATYLELEVTEDAIRTNVELKSKGITKSSELINYTVEVTPKVVIKTTRVKIRIDGVKNYRSARATLYGMASGYNFSKQESHTSESTHLMESWSKTIYPEGNDKGEITASFTCFGLPGQTTSTRAEDYSNWDGVIDVDILLVDNKTIISESIELYDKITTTTQESKTDTDIDTNIDTNVDINITTGYNFDLDPDSEDKPILLPDVTPEGSTSSGFDATVDDWGDEVVHDIPI